MIRPLAWAFSLIIVALQAAAAASGDLDAPFMTTVGGGFSKPINAVALQADGKILAGGNQGAFQGSGSEVLWRLKSDGSLDSAIAGFTTTSGVPEVDEIVVQADGKILVGGVFDHFDGVARGGILRLKTDGTLDTGFAPAGLSGTTRYVQDIELQGDGKVLIAGGFSLVNGAGRAGLARLNADGTLDNGFTPVWPFGYYFVTVEDAELLPDGKILAGGTYSPAFAQAGIPFIVRLNADGTVDGSFDGSIALSSSFGIQEVERQADGKILVSGSWSAGAGQNYWIRRLLSNGAPDASFVMTPSNGWMGGDIEILPDGKILGAGIFNSYANHPTASIVRLNPDGTVDTSFAPVPHTSARGEYGTHIYSVAVQPDGKLVCGGWMNHDDAVAAGVPVGNPGLQINGSNIFNIARFEGDAASGPGKVSLAAATVSAAEGSVVMVTATRYGGSMGAVSVGFSVAGVTATAGTDFVASSGTLTWANGETGPKTFNISLSTDSDSEGTEYANILLGSPTGGVTVGPVFAAQLRILDDDQAPSILVDPISQVVTATREMALVVVAESGLPMTYQWKKDGVDLSGKTGPILLVSDLQLTDAGNYTVVVTNAVGSTTSASATISVKLPPGYPDPGFSWPGGSGFSPASNVLGMLRLADGGYLVRAWNTTLGGISFNNMARLRADFTLDSGFSTNLGAGPNNGSIEDMVETADGKIYVLGRFSSFNGHSTSHVVRLDADGTVDPSFTAAIGGPSGGYALALDSAGRLLVSKWGAFVRLMDDGSWDPGFSFGPAVSLATNWKVHTIRPLANGKMIIAGSVPSGVSSEFTDFVYRLNADGSEDDSFVGGVRVMRRWGSSSAPAIEMLEVLPDGRVLIGGPFHEVDGVARNTYNSLRWLVMLRFDGVLDAGFSDRARTYGTTSQGAILSSLVLPNGQVVISGDFTTFDDQAIGKLFRLNPDGTLDSGFIAPAAVAASRGIQLALDGGIFLPTGLLLNDLPGIIRFAASDFSGVESDGTITVNAERVFGKDGAAGVSYSAVGGSATDGVDFTAVAGTLAWADGETGSKSFALTILPDTDPESDETVVATLSTPSGNGINLATPITASVTIIDDDSPPAFLAQPAGGTLDEGDDITLVAEVFSPLAIEFQWFLDGAEIAGATSSTLALNGIIPATGGSYQLRARNLNGDSFSASVTVIVIPEPAYQDPNFVFTTTLNSDVEDIIALPGGGAIVGGTFSSVPGLSGGRYLFKVGEDGVVDSTFNPAPSSSVHSLALQADGKILVGGNFTTIGGGNSSRIARLNADGTLDSTFATNLGSGANQRVDAIAVLPNDKIVLGGSFSSINSTNMTGYVAVLNADGTVDTGFESQANNLVFAVAAQADGKILASGFFTYGGATRFVRLNPNGSRDTNFDTSIAYGSTSIQKILPLSDGRIALGGTQMTGGKDCVILQANGTLDLGLSTETQFDDLAEQDNGKVIGVGSFSSRVGRWESNGTLDSAFRTALGTSFNSTCKAVALANFGKIWIGGRFTSFNGTSVNRLVLLNGDPVNIAILSQPVAAMVDPGTTVSFSLGAIGTTTLSYQWQKDGIDLNDGGEVSGATTATLQISNVAAGDEGHYRVILSNESGNLTSDSAELVVLGAPQILAQATDITAFVGDFLSLENSIIGLAPLDYSWTKDGNPLSDGGNISGTASATLEFASLTLADAGSYVLTASNGVGSESTTPIRVSVAPPPAGLASGFESIASSYDVKAILPLPDGRALVGAAAQLTGSNGNNPYNRLHVVNADGSIDLSPPFGVVQGDVTEIARLPNGKIIIAGTLLSVDGVARPGIARLNRDLSIDPAFDAGPIDRNGINCVATDLAGRILVGGSFTNWAGDTSLRYLVRLMPDGSLDTGFTTTFNAAVHDVEVLASGKLMVGGQFFSPGAYAVRLNDDGSRDFGFNLKGWTNTVFDLDLDESGRVYLAGNNPILRRYDVNGTWDQSFALSPSPNQYSAISVKIQRNGKILLGGRFRSSTNQTPRGFMRVDSDGNIDPGFDVGTGVQSNKSVLALAIGGDGKIWVGGDFQYFADVSQRYLAVLNGDAVNLAILSDPFAQAVEPGQTATFEVTATGTSVLSYQWMKDGSDLPGATGATLEISNVTAANIGSYSVVVSNSSGEESSTPADLILLGAPEILAGPVAVEQEAGLDASFSVSARGIQPMAYQWYRDGGLLTDDTRISGATTSSLNLGALELSDSGSLSVTITNSEGSVTTSPVSLSVIKHPAGIARSVVLPQAVNSTLFDVLPNDDGSYIIGGAFTSVVYTGGSAQRRQLAKFNANGSADLTFPQVNGNGYVYAIERAADGKIYVGGTFTSLNFNGTIVSHNRIVRINADGSHDDSFDPGTGANNEVKVIRSLANGKVLVGGSFSSFNGENATAYVTLLNEDGSVDTSFVSQAAAAVNDLVVRNDGTIWVALSWQWDTQTYLVRVDLTGSIISGYSHPGNIQAGDVIPHPDGGAIFASTSNPYIRKVMADGSVDTTWPATSGNFGPSYRVYELAAMGNGRTAIGGQFTTYGGSSIKNIAVLKVDGTLEPDFDPGSSFAGSYPNSIKVDSQGRLWCVGTMTTYKGESIPRLVVLNGYDPTASSDPFIAWAQGYSLPAGRDGFDDNGDGDQWNNGIEFLYRTDPSLSDGPGVLINPGNATDKGTSINALAPGAGLDPSKDYQVVTFRIPKDQRGLSVGIEASLDLNAMSNGSAQATEFGNAVDDGDYELRRYYLTPAASDHSNMWWRLKVTQP